jgi:hypothetical protein
MVLFEGLTSSGKAKVVNVDEEGNLVLLGSSPTPGVSLQEGTDISGATMPAGGASGRGWLSAIWQLINDRVPALAVVSNALQVGGIVTANIGTTGNLATDATLQQVLDAVKAQIDISSTIWTDNSGVYYVRKDIVNESTGTITVSFTDPSGNVATPGTGLKPLASSEASVITDFYNAIASGTGYSTGDLLARVAILNSNISPPSATFFWLNFSTGLVLSSNPSTANIQLSNSNVSIDNITGTISLPTGAAKDSSIQALLSQSDFDSKVPSNLTVTNNHLLVDNTANIQPISGTVTANMGSGNLAGITNTVIIKADTAANQINPLSVTLAKGQALMANSIPMVIASDQSTNPSFASQSDAQAISNRLMPVGTISLYLGTSSGANIKSSAGVIYAITCTNDNATIRYFQIINKASNPALNDVPLLAFPVYPNDGLLIIGQDILGGAGINLSTGITWGFSTTRLTYTAATATDCITSVRWA